MKKANVKSDVKKELLNQSDKQVEAKNTETEDSTLRLEMESAIASFSTEFCTPFAVIPLTYCPHLEHVKEQTQVDFKFDIRQPCKVEICCEPTENWICLTCNEIFCSRYVNNHMVDHFEQHKHPMALSFSDLSVWCYDCESYVDNEILKEAKLFAYQSKFGRPPLVN